MENDSLTKFWLRNFDKYPFLVKKYPKILLLYFCNFHKRIKNYSI